MRTLAILLLTATTATAGSFNPALEDPQVIAPQCVWFGFIPCHTGFRYTEPEGDEPRELVPFEPLSDWISGPEPQPEPEPKVCK